MQVLVFKTNMENTRQVNRLNSLFEAGIPGVRQLTVDLDDCDRVLRVAGYELCPRQVETLVQQAGHECVEMED